MIDTMNVMISKMIGTLAVISLTAAFIGNSDILEKYMEKSHKWKHILLMGVIGGAFGIYGNLSGFDFNGAVISVRDIGPMLSGFIGGPIGGLIAGLMAAVHRLTMGGITANACAVATCCIGLMCGLISFQWHAAMRKPLIALLISSLMEAFHLGVVLLMVKPFETAFGIVKSIALPFIIINALGFMLIITIINNMEKQRTILLDRNRLQSELEVATVIQKSMLPVINEEYPGIDAIDVSASMQTAKEVGGDFYDVFYVDRNRIAFVIGDVSGKGIPAALFMATAKTTLQNCIRDIPSLADAVETANNVLCASNEAEMFVTLWVGILDLTSYELQFISAGHNPPVVVHGDKGSYLKMKNGFVLAGMEGVHYKEHTVQLYQDDIVFLYTDGVTEATDSNEALYGEERLLQCFENTAESSTSDILKKVTVSVEAFVQGNSQFDDMTMLCFKLK